MDITCCTSGRGNFILGDSEGGLTFISRDYNIYRYQAYDCRVTHAYMLHNQNILVTIGDGIDSRPDDCQEISRNSAAKKRAQRAEESSIFIL